MATLKHSLSFLRGSKSSDPFELTPLLQKIKIIIWLHNWPPHHAADLIGFSGRQKQTFLLLYFGTLLQANHCFLRVLRPNLDRKIQMWCVLHLDDCVDPVEHFFDVAVDAWAALSSTADTPAHHANQVPPSRGEVHQRSSAVSLGARTLKRTFWSSFREGSLNCHVVSSKKKKVTGNSCLSYTAWLDETLV